MEDFVRSASNRNKRGVEGHRHKKMLGMIRKKRDAIEVSLRIRKRESRDYEIDRAYSKYYEKIKNNYRNYVKNLFPNPKSKSLQENNSYSMQPSEEVKSTKKMQVQDGRWYNSYNNAEFRYRATHKARAFSNDLQNDEYESEMGPVALPSINDPARSYPQRAIQNETMSNYYPSNHGSIIGA